MLTFPNTTCQNVELPLEIELNGYLYFHWWDCRYHKVKPYQGTVSGKVKIIEAIEEQKTQSIDKETLLHLLEVYNHPLYTSLFTK